MGLKPFATIAVLVYDIFSNVFLNAMFLWPLLYSGSASPRIRTVARRNLLAAVVTLATSTTNLAMITALKNELAWVCLGSCGADVTLNAMVIFWLTTPGAESPTYDPPTANRPNPIGTSKISSPSSTHKPQISLGTALFDKPVDAPGPCCPTPEDNELHYIATVPDFPVSPTVVSASVGNMSMVARSQDEDAHSPRKSIGLRSLGEFFGVSTSGSDAKVQVSMITQQDLEMGDLESLQAKQDDEDSLDQAKSTSGWYK
ncbi:unnamed protein product [Rhizoctonia solani]|uniref:Uncharacterized protein n=1 Tax=Rhizoctonia solani TaxID=456999 RepID=A0A8H3BB87_9AGAM|nr:unnamed protein product [Rhizoctonia solani]